MLKTSTIKIKVIPIKTNQKKIIVYKTTAKALEDMRELRTHRKPGEHKYESYDAVIQRMIQLIKLAKQIAKSERNKADNNGTQN